MGIHVVVVAPMRTLILASLALTPACLIGSGDISGTGDTGKCGDGVINAGETCDDGNTVSGDGCSSTCQIEDTNSPHVVLSVDKLTVTSDLNTTTTIMVTATGMMNFSGDLALTVAAADSSAATITDWTTALDSSTLEVSTDGTASAMLTLSAMGDTAMLTGNLTVTATGGNAASPATVTIPTTFNPVLDVTFTDDGTGKCAYPIGHGVNNPYQIKVGRQIAVYNGSAVVLGMIVHTNAAIAGLPHEEPRVAPGTQPTQAYVSTIGPTAQPGDEDTFYCHDPNTPLTMLGDAGVTANYPALKVVQ